MTAAQFFPRSARGRILFVVLFLFVFRGLPGQSRPERRAVDDLVFKVAVYGPSDEIFIWWGHAALVVENTRWGYARVFDWGIFSYPSDNFLWDFLHDRVSYKCTVEPVDFEAYIEEDRDITVYTLDLDAEKKEIVLAYAENNVLSENCYYDYHEFRDNCSTRIRDIIDMGTGGQLKKRFAATPGRFTLRQHIRRFTWSRPFSDGFLDFLMGQDLDEPVTVWDEMFLPVEIGRTIVDFKYTDVSGAERKLVSSVAIVNSTKNRPPVLNAPPRTWPRDLMLAVTLVMAVLCIGVLRRKKPRAGRILWGLCQSALGIFLGAAGLVLLYGLFFMKHDYIQQNINIWFINPLLLAAAPLGVFMALNKTFPLKPETCLRLLWTYVFAAGLFTQLVKVFPLFFQQNQSTAALILPVVFVFCYIPAAKISPGCTGGRGSG
jgi:hypothetical protein